VSRLAHPMLAVAVIVAGCSADGPGARPVPTVPTVAPTTSATPGAVDEAEGSEGEATATTTTTTGTTTIPLGDLLEASVELQEIAVLDEPVTMTTVDGDGSLWIGGRQGQVVRLDPTTGVAEEVLDLSAMTVGRGERGLLGIVAHDGYLYVDYTDIDGNTHVDGFRLSGAGVDVDSRRELLYVEQPFSNHNGGGLAFDDAGHLYVGLGDGGSGGDPLGSGQDPTTWLGSILRVDPTPEADAPYSIPDDNPFADGVGGLPEVFLFGVRNPWRFSFDSLTGDLWIGDVGQDAFEEITLLLAANGGGAGANLGWNLREGLHQYRGPEPEGHVDPVYEYGRDQGISVTGGFVYRGEVVPELYGNYVFGDYQTAQLWGLDLSDGEVVFRDLGVAIPGGELASFGEGPDGELYALSLSGPVSRIVPA